MKKLLWCLCLCVLGGSVASCVDDKPPVEPSTGGDPGGDPGPVDDDDDDDDDDTQPEDELPTLESEMHDFCVKMVSCPFPEADAEGYCQYARMEFVLEAEDQAACEARVTEFWHCMNTELSCAPGSPEGVCSSETEAVAQACDIDEDTAPVRWVYSYPPEIEAYLPSCAFVDACVESEDDGAYAYQAYQCDADRLLSARFVGGEGCWEAVAANLDCIAEASTCADVFDCEELALEVANRCQ